MAERSFQNSETGTTNDSNIIAFWGPITVTSENTDLQPGDTISVDGEVEGDYYYQGIFTQGGNDYPVFRTGYNENDETFSGDILVAGDQSLEWPGLNGGEVDNDVVSTGLTVCFMPGTLISTPSGPRAVETLEAGDLICTADGHTVPVVWMGRQSVHKLFTPAERFCPIRIRAGALAPEMPARDLLVTADHALMLDGLAVNAAALVNGRSILREPKEALPEKLTYWHIETAAHDVVLAEGAPAETFVDNVTRRRFDNHADYEARFGAERRHIEESPAPRVMSRRQLPESLRMRLAARAEELEQAETAAA